MIIILTDTTEWPQSSKEKKKSSQRNTHSTELNDSIGRKATKEQLTVKQIAARYDVYPHLTTQSKQQAIKQILSFAQSSARAAVDDEKPEASLSADRPIVSRTRLTQKFWTDIFTH